MDKTKIIDGIKHDILNYMSIDVMYYGGRAETVLRAAGIKTLRDLISTNEMKLLSVFGCGRKTLNDIKIQMEECGLEFGMKIPEWNTEGGNTIFEKLSALNDN